MDLIFIILKILGRGLKSIPKTASGLKPIISKNSFWIKTN